MFILKKISIISIMVLAVVVPTGNAGQLTFTGTTAVPETTDVLYWSRPATNWKEAVPIGNGRLGGMVSGGVDTETIWLNEDTLWSGEPTESNNPEALKTYPKVQKLLLDRQEAEANALYDQKMLGQWNQCYMPMGNLNLEFSIDGEIKGYRRCLDMMTGVVSVEFENKGITYRREIFSSSPDQAMFVRLFADKTGQVSFTASLTSLIRNKIEADGSVLRMVGQCPVHSDPHYLGTKVVYDEGENPKGMRFATEVAAIGEGGTVSIKDGKIVAEKCDAVTLILMAATSYNGFDKSPSAEGRDAVAACAKNRQAIKDKSYGDLKDRHEADFSGLMKRVSLNLGRTASADRPINERVGKGFKEDDLGALVAQYYQFGRYLLVSSSRVGSQPANLQGIWSRKMNPAWSSNWTMNCNAEFNYLGVETANLSELHEPFIRLVSEWSVDGNRTAKMWYGCDGWVGHHNCDIWRAACPTQGTALWAAFPCGGAWACQHLWEHYSFTLDEGYLREIWPTMRGAAKFFLDFLVEDTVSGYLVTTCDVNFENGFSKSDGKSAALCLAPTPSNMMVRELFLNCIEASKVLETDAGLRERMEKAVVKLPPTKVNPRNGELQEYLDPEYKISSRGLCELLSTWGLIWCDQIRPCEHPEFAAAIRKAYEAADRRPWVTGNVGSWQGAFPANTFARLGDGERVAEILSKHFEVISNPNFTAGFIQSEWMIDGNLGGMAAIGEMLVQSHTEVIELLPGMPKAWAEGSVKGLKGRGNVTIDFTWKSGRVTEVKLYSTTPKPVQVRVNGKIQTITPEKI